MMGEGAERSRRERVANGDLTMALNGGQDAAGGGCELIARVYKDEAELETYIRSDLYGTCNHVKECSNPKIRGAVVFHGQGPQIYDYSIRLNHTWAFSGFPDVKTIMDVNGPYVNDLELGLNTVPILQYGFSGFLTLQQVLDSFIIFASQLTERSSIPGDSDVPTSVLFHVSSLLRLPSMRFIPSNIRIVPFPTREYTDDEFQYIIKNVMGVLLFWLLRHWLTQAFQRVGGTLRVEDFGSVSGVIRAVLKVVKAAASLLSPTAFALGSINFADYERAHVGLRWSNIWRESSGVNFLVCLSMLLIDTLLYCAVGVYLDKVCSSELLYQKLLG
ncbi:hypothetical protein Cgig2_025894 [Carnegiea gigantea]|uniref:Uncharacterized protein n=1 Tax=Carnegiea gigantea TaxID=171969 RepID=A0A9Q1K5J1_9CARY|nr:hypothetical protein Cgig2_025894 [Carnegiea gigantea]